MKLKQAMESMPSTQQFILKDVTTGKEIEGDVYLFFHRYFADKIANLPDSEVIHLSAVDSRMKIYVKTDDERMEDKARFIQHLGELLSNEACRLNVKKAEYVWDTYGEEFAVITFNNGFEKRACITGDSCLAIMNDIYKTLV